MSPKLAPTSLLPRQSSRSADEPPATRPFGCDWWRARHRSDGGGNQTMALDRVASRATETPADGAVATSTRGSSINTPAYPSAGTGRERRRPRSTESSTAPDERFRPYRHLAMRVLARAVLDMMDPAGSSTDRESARAFLSGSVMLHHWCRVAALNPDRIAEGVERLRAGFAAVPQGMQGTRTLQESDVQ